MSLPRFGVRRPVPANLLTAAAVVAGVVCAMALRLEFFPESAPDVAMVTLPYPGATAEEIEQTLAIKVEDKLRNIEQIKEIRATLSEGGGGLTIKFNEGEDPDEGVDEIERAIEGLQDLPAESEKIQVRLFQPRLPVIRLSLSGDLDERTLKRAIRNIQSDLRDLPGMGEVQIFGVRDYEIQINVDREAMLRHGLSLPAIRDLVRAWMLDLPGGTVRTPEGNTRVRTMGTPERADAIGDLVLRADAQGRAVRVRDVATVVEGFVDDQISTRFNGKPSASLTVFKVGEQDIVRIAGMVRAYVDGRNNQPLALTFGERLAVALPQIMPNMNAQTMKPLRLLAWESGKTTGRPLPAGAIVRANSDLARFVEGRLDLLKRNAVYGAILVFATLLFFLNWRVALWVGVGLVTALMGTLVLMYMADITLNLMTMFGLIVVLGLLVDDAIVVSENIQTHHEAGVEPLKAGIDGGNQVAWPVVATVLTSVVAFLPLMVIKGQIGDLLGALPLVVACALLMSLGESLLILPSHMAHSLRRAEARGPSAWSRKIAAFEAWRDRVVMQPLIDGHGWLLGIALRYRYIAASLAVALLMVSIGMVQGGRVAFVFLPESDSETIVIDVAMPIGTPASKTEEIVEKIEAAAQAQEETKSVGSVVGQVANLDTGLADASATHRAQMFLELKAVELRQRTSADVVESIRKALEGKLDEADRIGFSEISGGPAGADITIQIRGDDSDQMRDAAREIKDALARHKGVNEIADDDTRGQKELQVRLKDEGAALGFTTAEVWGQMRGFLYGLEAHVYAADQEDIKVRVRLDESDRQGLHEIEHAWIVAPSGRGVPLAEVADVSEHLTYATIKRLDSQRVIQVTADTSPGVSPETIMSSVADDLEAVRHKYPDLIINTAGRQEQMADAFASLPYGFGAALLGIYVILAWLFSSYWQPLIVLMVIPFAAIGVIWGHYVLGYELTFLSMIGFVALSGIVVNDSLILIKFYNERRGSGDTVLVALLAAGRARFRAILLTTITTVLGLTPLMLEQSFQAKFMIPMAITIAVGLLAGTVLILVVVPCFLLIGCELGGLLRWIWTGHRPAVDDRIHS